MNKKYIFLLFLCRTLCAQTLEIIIEPITSENIDTEINLLVRSWQHAYTEINTTISDPSQKLPEADESWFDYERESFAQHLDSVFFVKASHNNKLVGYCSFEKTAIHHEVYLRELAVDPDFFRNGIGSQLVHSIFSLAPETERVLVVTRKLNTPAISFYKKIGFVECDYVHPFFGPQDYVSLEYVSSKPRI